MAPIDHFCCQNSDCLQAGVRGGENLHIRGDSGKGRRIRLVYCRTCKRSFSERKGTVLEHARLPDEKALALLNHLREGCGTRATGRLVEVDKNTVTRYLAKAGAHAERLHDELVALSPRTREVQVDEKWGYVAKKEASRDPTDPLDRLRGDDWDHTAVDPESRLLLALVPGERDGQTSERLIRQVHDRTGGRTDLLRTSDEHAPYETAIGQVYGVKTPRPRRPGPGRPPWPAKVVPADLCYATVRKRREKGRVVEVVRALVFGTLYLLGRSSASTTINTSFVERNNGTDRHQNSRKRRKTCAFSKDLAMYRAASYSIGFSYNFCWPVRTLRGREGEGPWQARTPAMAAGLSDHVWDTRKWVTYPTKPR